MEEFNTYLVIATAILAVVALISATLLRAWREWLAFKQLELRTEHDAPSMATQGANARIELADLKERIRKLEAIAEGIDY